MEAAGILSIDLSYADIDMQDAHGNIHRQISTVMRADGAMADIADVWFVRDLADSGTDSGELRGVSADVADLPDIRGFGTVHGLHQAMMMDDSGELQRLLERFTTEPDEAARRQMVSAILRKWSGATTNLQVLEAFTGDKYTGGTGPNAMAVINRGYSHVCNTVYYILMAHTHYRHLYEAAVMDGSDLENMTVDFTDVAGVLLDRIDEDRDSGEALLVNYIINLHMLSIFDYIEYDSFFDALDERNSTYSYLAEIGRKNILVGTAGNDTVTGTSTADAYWYEYGNNILTDSGGNDTYFFADWFGYNTIRDSSGYNHILFLSGIRQEDLQIARIDGTPDISISTEESQGRLVVRSGPAYELVFTDGSTCNLYDLLEFEEISTPEQLEQIRHDLAGFYRLTEDIDLAGVAWVPVGTSITPFLGVLDGNGHTILNLTIDASANNYTGLIGYNKGRIAGLSLSGIQVSGRDYTGGLAGYSYGSIEACTVDGTVKGNKYTGGLVGYSRDSIKACTVDVTVKGYSYTGGLAGYSVGIIEGSAVTGGSVTGSRYTGGLAGYLRRETRDSYATVNVSGTSYIGGLAGFADGGIIEQCYATGHVTARSYAGGLVGSLNAAIRNSFATGNVSPGDYTAGFVGHMESGTAVTIVNSYSLSNNPNGLIYRTGNITGSYFDKSLISGIADQPEGRTTAEMKQQSAYTDAGWDFDTVWMMGAEGYPILRGMPEPVMIYTEISTPAGLEAIRQDLSGNYRLTADIDLSGIEWIPLGDDQAAFTGILDGNGHTVSNVTVNQSAMYYAGLIGNNKGNILSLSLTNVRISGHIYTGGLAGYNSGRIEACHVDGNVTGVIDTGGLVGYNYGGVIEGSSATGGLAVGTSSHVGGLVGYLVKGSVTNSYATVNVVGKEYAGGLIGLVGSGIIEQCYAIGNVTAENCSGGFAGYLGDGGTLKNNFAMGNVHQFISSGVVGYMGGFAGYIATTDAGQIVNNYSLSKNPNGFSYNKSTTTASFFNKDLISKTSVQPEGRTTEEMKQQSTYTDAGWDFGTVWMMGEGGYPVLRGLPEPARSYTEISTPEDLEAIRQNLYGNYRLTADIDLSGQEWIPLGSDQAPFSGILDGNGYKIHNLTVSLSKKDYVGLIGYNKGEITGLTLNSVQVTGRTYTGGLAGYNLGYIEACNVDGYVAGYSYTGGLVGYSRGVIESSAMTGGTVEGESNYIGGLSGTSGGSIRNSYAASGVSGKRQVGGLVGSGGGIIERCYATGDVTAESHFGGFVGSAEGYFTIKDSFATGSVPPGDNTAGFVGYISGQNGRIENSYSRSDNPNGFSYRTGTTVNCYFDKTLTNWAGSPTQGRTTAEMKQQSTYTDAGWDFDTVWMMGQAGYPVLKGLPEPDDGTGGTDDNVHYTEISTQQELLAIREDMSGSYRLTADIDLSGTAWMTMGTYKEPFTGELDGNGYAIKNMRINEPGQNYFGRNSGKITDLTLTNVWVSGRNYTGGLAGDNDGIIEGCAVIGGQVTGTGYYAGGLVGSVSGGTVRNSHAAADVSGASEVGGLAGYAGNWYGYGVLIEQCQATGQVTADRQGGGLIGNLGRAVTVVNSLAVVQVSSGSYSAGFVGYIGTGVPTAKIENSYSLSGNINGFSYSGGNLTSCYFDMDLAGGNTTQAEGRSTAEMKDQATYSGWDFENIWEMQEDSYPTLRSMSGYAIVFPDNPGDGDEDPDNPGDGDEDPDNPGGGDGDEDPDNPGDGNGDEDPDNPGGGDGDEDPDNPGDGNGDVEPDNPGDSSGDTYDPNMIYVAGDTVVYNGSTYKAKWWTKGGAAPDTNQAWEKISGGDGGGTGSADAYNAAKGGDRVMYEGHIYQAKWWTRGNTPGSSDVWELIE